MPPGTHLLTSWIIAAKATRNPRDCRLATLAGVLPDADGLGLFVDLYHQAIGGKQTFLYSEYHHILLHGAFGALVIAGTLACFARQRLRVFVLSLAMVHLHFLCDLAGSRGPSSADLWPIYYLAPFRLHPVWVWTHQWRLDGWQNRWLSAALFVWALRLGGRYSHSVVGVFNRRADGIVCPVLRKWRDGLMTWKMSR
jgi:hypothetical protein